MTQLGSKKYECACGWQGKNPPNKEREAREGDARVIAYIIYCPHCKKDFPLK